MPELIKALRSLRRMELIPLVSLGRSGLIEMFGSTSAMDFLAATKQ